MKTKETFLTIDPPSGWKYGFPKAVTQEQYKEIKSLKQWCIDNGYPKEEADSYGDYFYIQINGDLSFMNENKSTKEQHIAWWNKLKYDSPVHLEFYAKKYFQRDWDTLTGREIEEIWLKETQNHTNDSMGTVFISSIDSQNTIKPNQKQYSQEEVDRLLDQQAAKTTAQILKSNQKQYSQEENKKEYIQRIGRVNRKQFKQFDESFFKAYIDKLPESESLNMIKIIYENKLPDCKFKAYLDKWFKL